MLEVGVFLLIADKLNKQKHLELLISRCFLFWPEN